MVVWRWLSADRYFGDEGGEGRRVRTGKRDFNDSRKRYLRRSISYLGDLNGLDVIDSFRILARHKINSPVWYQRFGIHNAFDPPPQLADDILAKRKCTDVLVTYGGYGKNPELFVFNPGRIVYPGKEAIVPPEFDLRVDINSLSDDSDEEGDVMDTSSDLSEIEEDTRKSGGNGKGKGKASGSEEMDYEAHYPIMEPWTIKPKGFLTAAKEVAALASSTSSKKAQSKAAANTPAAVGSGAQPLPVAPANVHTIIRCTALSPGGAEWLVGVGEWGSVILYRLRSEEEME